MKNKGFIVFLTVIISLLCIYYLSFTFVAQGVQQEATDQATDPSGTVNFTEKQRYLDSVWNTPIYSLLGQDYTYQDIKETELNLGLDLQGGMHVTLEVSPVDILKGLSDNNQDPNYLEAINTAEKNIRGTQLNFLDEFYIPYYIYFPHAIFLVRSHSMYVPGLHIPCKIHVYIFHVIFSQARRRQQQPRQRSWRIHLLSCMVKLMII